ncbi:hypothetical protein [Burkholderia sp. Ax-1719]|uniref:hypothetical protein n=1 Tax=Burkholderia sp. Ax-1719 TaxID=2608334 RepID=UPI00141E0258|nr:hypothetical protein [Burkholderia sp. Ax-1719]NIE63124.1 hypothetical protein [Burkholderia sp. Ax-1719]
MANALDMAALPNLPDLSGTLKNTLEFQRLHLDSVQRINSARKQFEELLRPSIAIQRQFEAVTAASVQAQKNFEKLIAPMNQLRLQIDQIGGPIAEIQKRMEETKRLYVGYDVSARYVKQIREMADFVNRHHLDAALTSGLSDNIRKMGQLPTTLASLRVFGEEHTRYIERLRVQINNLAVSPELARTWSNATADLATASGEDSNSEINEFSSSLGRTKTLAEAAEVLLHYAAGPATKVAHIAWQLLWTILIGWFINQLPGVAELEEKFGLTHREAVKAVRASPPLDLTEDQRESLRFVCAPILSAHISPKQRSKIRARLSFGTHVVVDQRIGDWVHAIYRDPLTGDEDEGWLLARYVSKFNR